MPEKHEHSHDHKPAAEGRQAGAAPMVLPPAAQQLIMQLQTFQQQYQTVAIQKESLIIQKMEIDKALEELGKAAEKEEVFKAVGPILIKSTKAALSGEMAEKKEMVEARLKSVDAQESRLREKINEVQGRLQSMLGEPGHHREPEDAEEGESAG